MKENRSNQYDLEDRTFAFCEKRESISQADPENSFKH
jgi:hypothetical protein